MTQRYALKIISEFSSAHRLRDYPGDCRRLHGHNWKVEVEVIASRLNESGMGIDFKDIKRATREITDRLDHQFLNDIAPFTQKNPTAENIAAYLYAELTRSLNASHLRVGSVTLWETERACVRYSRD